MASNLFALRLEQKQPPPVFLKEREGKGKEEVGKRALPISEETVVSSSHPLLSEEDFEDICSLNTRAISIFKLAVGEQHSALGVSMNNLGLLKMAQGKLKEAGGLFESALTIFSKSMGKKHEFTVKARQNFEKCQR